MLNLVREGEEDYIEAIRYRRRLKIFENFLFNYNLQYCCKHAGTECQVRVVYLSLCSSTDLCTLYVPILLTISKICTNLRLILTSVGLELFVMTGLRPV